MANRYGMGYLRNILGDTTITSTRMDMYSMTPTVRVAMYDQADQTLGYGDTTWGDPTSAGWWPSTRGSGTFSRAWWDHGSANAAGWKATTSANLPAATGDQMEYVVFYADTGTSATSIIIAIFDTMTGLPFTPNGGAVTVQLTAVPLLKLVGGG